MQHAGHYCCGLPARTSRCRGPIAGESGRRRLTTTLTTTLTTVAPPDTTPTARRPAYRPAGAHYFCWSDSVFGVYDRRQVVPVTHSKTDAVKNRNAVLLAAGCFAVGVGITLGVDDPGTRVREVIRPQPQFTPTVTVITGQTTSSSLPPTPDTSTPTWTPTYTPRRIYTPPPPPRETPTETEPPPPPPICWPWLPECQHP